MRVNRVEACSGRGRLAQQNLGRNHLRDSRWDPYVVKQSGGAAAGQRSAGPFVLPRKTSPRRHRAKWRLFY